MVCKGTIHLDHPGFLDSLEEKVVETRETITHLEGKLGKDVERTGFGLGVGRTEWLRCRPLLSAFWIMLLGRELLRH